MPSSSLHFAVATEPGLPAGQGQGQGPRKLKLRDSCDACASSKVRCHKEKPTCSRCARRGLACEYVATRRAGRKHDSSRQSNGTNGTNSTNSTNGTGSHNSKVNAPAPPGAGTPAQSHSQPAAATSITVAAVAQQSPVAHSSLPSPSPSLSYLLSNLSSPEEAASSDAMLSIGSLTDPTDFDGSSLTNPLSFVVPAAWNTDILGQSYFFPTSDTPNGTSATNIVEIFPSFKFADDVLDFSSHSAEALPHELETSSTPNAPDPLDVQKLQGEEEDVSNAHGLSCCLTKALGLVTKLSPEPVALCKTSSFLESYGGEGAEGHQRSGPTIQTVIATNEATLETLGAMLECSCSDDAYLLVIMSLVVFKVLAWYGAASQKPPSEHDISTITTTNNNITTATATAVPSITATAATTAPPIGIRSRNSSSAGSSSTQSPHRATTPSSTSRSNRRQWSVVQHQVPAVVKNYYLEGKDSGRMAAQLVLSELHRVQRVVSRLVTKMKTLRLAVDGGIHEKAEEDADATPRALIGGLDLGLGGVDEGGPTLPYSGLILDQLGADMKQKLRTLSIGIVKGLSEGE